jgi:hypothetical protein
MTEYIYNGNVIKKGLTMYDVKHTFAKDVQSIETLNDQTVITLKENEDVKTIIITLEKCLVTKIMIVRKQKEEL